jgi:hypothetical protein
MAAVPSRFMLEYNMTPNPLKEGVFKEWFGVKEGYCTLNDKPGLGVELKEGLEEMYPPLAGNYYKPDPGMPSFPRPKREPITDDWPSRPGHVDTKGY